MESLPLPLPTLYHCGYDAQNMEITRHIWNEYGADNLSVFGVIFEYEENMTGANNTFVLGSFYFIFCQVQFSEWAFIWYSSKIRIFIGISLFFATVPLQNCYVFGIIWDIVRCLAVPYFYLPKVGKHTAHTFEKYVTMGQNRKANIFACITKNVIASNANEANCQMKSA